MKKLYTALVLTLFVLPLIAQTIPSFVPKDGLVGYWPFNGNANDESGKGNHGKVNGATLTADRNGVANSAYSFDGVQNYITTETTGFPYANQERTLVFWAKYSLDPNYATAHMVNYGQVTDGNSFGGMMHNGRTWWFYGHNDNYYDLNSGISVDDKWHLFTFTYSNSIVSIYFDGKLITNKSISLNTLNGLMYFGARQDLYSDRFFKGQLDDIALYNRALSEQEILALYSGTSCPKETATSSSFNSLLFSNGSAVSISAEPQGGVFSGASIENNQFIPSKAKIGSNKVKYNFKNSKGCADSTLFTMVVADTVGASCTKYDTVKVTKFDTVTVTNNVIKYDTVTVKTNVFDTVKVTKFDTITVKNSVYDTVTVTNNVTKYDTITVTNNVTKYDTLKVTKFDTVTITNNVTKYDTLKVTKFDTVTITNIVTKYDTLKVTKFDTVTVTNNVTKYDTVIVNKTKYDTVIVKTNVFDTLKVTKYDTLTVKNNIYDTVSILKIKFKLTTGVHANQLSSLSIYPNPTSDVLHIEVPDAKVLEGYRYRILDALGKEVYNQLVTQSTTEIPLKTLGAAGIYQFEILDATKTSIQSNKIVLY